MTPSAKPGAPRATAANPPSGSPGPASRSLADDFRARSDDELTALLEERPDLTHPVPADLGALAVRATVGVSVARALDRLDRFGLDVVDALCVLPDPTTADEVATLVGIDPGGTDRGVLDLLLERLRLMGLWWGSAVEIRLVRGVRDLIGPHPGGLGPESAAVDGLDDLLAQAPEQALEVLRRLEVDGPTGAVTGAGRRVTVESAKTPVEWLLARGMLVAVDDATVALPRALGLTLRGGTIRPEPRIHPPEVDGRPIDPARVDATAAHAATTFVRAVEDVLEAWSIAPPKVLRAGGLGVRELRATADLLDSDEQFAALVVETAYSAGLLDDSGEFEPTWVPTQAYDVWLTQEVAARWVSLAHAWLSSPRVVGLAGSKDNRDNRIAPLGPELERSAAVEIRAAALEEAAAVPPGTAVEDAEVTAVLAWRRPRRATWLRDQLVSWTFGEAEQLGVTGQHALAEYGRALLATDRELATTLLSSTLPAPVDKVVLQADLTAVAPGPLESGVARELSLLADVESTGGATVFRFSEKSVRRALDAGRDAVDLRTFLERVSLTPVPQPLAYLVEDVARRHGALRVGTASAYLRCDDESVVAELLADRRAAGLGLRRLAPTVLASGTAVDALLDRLRELGYAPMAESADGAVVVRRPDAKRAPNRRRGPLTSPQPSAPGPAMCAAAVRAMRAGERAAAIGPRGRPDDSADAGKGAGRVGEGTRGRADDAAQAVTARAPVVLAHRSSADTLAALKAATEAGRTVWIGYSDNHGAMSERVVDPVRVSGGFLTAFDHRTGSVRTFAIHRVTGLADVQEPS